MALATQKATFAAAPDFPTFIASSGKAHGNLRMRLLQVSVVIAWLGSLTLAHAAASREPPPDLSFPPWRAEFDLSRGHDIGNIVAAVRREYPGTFVDARYVDHGAHS